MILSRFMISMFLSAIALITGWPPNVIPCEYIDVSCRNGSMTRSVATTAPIAAYEDESPLAHVMMSAGCRSAPSANQRRFEMRELRARKLAQFDVVGSRAFVENNEGVGRFAPFFMWESDDRHFLHGGVSQKHAFNFDRRNVFAAADDDVFQAVANFDVTIRMHDRGVAGVKPSAA